MVRAARKSSEAEALNALRKHLSDLQAYIPSLSEHAARKARVVLDEIRTDLARTSAQLDPIREPISLFDPADLDTAGRLVALALLAQRRVPLDRIARTYGAGVYAIYYRGDHPFYRPVSGTETPLYVGKADPKTSQARTAREQQSRLYGRLNDHRKVLRRAETYALKNGDKSPLRVADFECRRLVTATNAQFVAERHLINLFRPVWNSDTKVCWGISKHGDKDGRSNDRSPWHVVHPTEYWASQTRLEDARTPERIVDDIARHFATHRIFANREEIIEEFLTIFEQDPMIASTPIEDDGIANDESQEEDT
jgi:hypothetical protein